MNSQEMYNSLETLASELRDLRRKRRTQTTDLDVASESVERQEGVISHSINSNKTDYPNADSRKSAIAQATSADKVVQSLNASITIMKDEIASTDADIEFKKNRIQNLRLLFGALLGGLSATSDEE